MLNRTLRSISVAVALALGATLAAAAGPNASPGPHGNRGAAVPYVAPTTEEAADLAFVREVEKLARDLYINLGEKWDSTPFAFIANAEQNHMDAMLNLLLRYRLPDPAATTLLGEFTDPRVGALYASLLERGMSSELEALLTGGFVEEVDLQDLATATARTAKTDILSVYANLACGSRNHLRSFAANARALSGQAYVAQSMSQAAVDAILAQPWERCGQR
jgi:hypothetical protein